MKKRLFIMICLVCLLMPLASAAMEWDNIGDYDEETRTITITNALGLGDDIAEATLNTPQINYVVRGNNRLVAEFTINSYEDYDNVFNKIEFYDIYGKKFEREFIYRYATYEEKVVFDYTTLCNNKIEFTDCTRKLIGSHIENELIWNELNTKTILLRGVTRIGIFTDVRAGETVEWIPTLYGVKVNEWARWTEGLGVSLVAYWSFEEGAGIVAEDVSDNDNNLTGLGTPHWETGINGTGTNLYRHDSESWTNKTAAIGINLNTSYPFTSNIWFRLNSTSAASGQYLFWQSAKDVGGYRYYLRVGTTNKLEGAILSVEGYDMHQGTTVLVKDNWYMATIVVNNTYFGIYLNSTLDHTPNITARTPDGVIGSFSLGAQRTIANPDNPVNFFNGTIDEVGIWNRTLSKTEINQLYNNGTGIKFEGYTDPYVNLNFPDDDFHTLEHSILFGANHTSSSNDLKNTTLYVWYSNSTLLGTNTTLISGGLNQTNLNMLGFTNGEDYVWNFLTCINAGTCKFHSVNRTLGVELFLEGNMSYNATTYETSTENYILNITTSGDTPSDVKFFYDNVEKTATTTPIEGNNYTLSAEIDIPFGTGAKNVFFGLTLGGTELNTSTNSQTTYEILIGSCGGALTTTALNFKAWDETNLSKIDRFNFKATFLYWLGKGTDVKNISFNNLSVSEVDICINPGNKTFYIDADIQYQANSTGYVIRNYYFENDSINNITQNISLYLLNSSDSTSFILQVINQNQQAVEGAIIHTQRYYPELGDYRIVQMAKTDANGKSVGFFKTETVDYRFIIKLDGVTQLITSKQKVVPEETPYTLVFTIGAALDTPWAEFEELENLESNLTFNKTSNITTFIYVDTSGNFTRARLFVEEIIYNQTNILICNLTSTESSDTILCDLTAYSGSFIAYSFITRTTEKTISLIQFTITTAIEILGLAGLFLGWFIILVGGCAFFWHPIAGIVGIEASIILVNIIGLISFSPLFLFASLAIAIILIWIIKE